MVTCSFIISFEIEGVNREFVPFGLYYSGKALDLMLENSCGDLIASNTLVRSGNETG